MRIYIVKIGLTGFKEGGENSAEAEETFRQGRGV
jgi:hypothetical protein